MNTNIQESFKPYQKRVFWTMLTMGICFSLIGGVVFYWIFGQRIFTEAQDELKQIAVRTAAFIPAELHESITKPDDQNGENYKLLTLYLRSIKAGNPNIDDIYTLRPTNTPHQYTFVLSAMETADNNKNGLIEQSEIRPAIGEKYDASEMPELEAGLNGPSADKFITYDKWGAWLSGYAPLTDSNGKAVAIVGVDYAASTISADRHAILKVDSIIIGVIILLLVVVIFLVSRRISRPFRILAQGMDWVAKGDLSHRLPIKGKGEEAVFVHLFNRMIEGFERMKHHEIEKHLAEKEKEKSKEE